MAVVRRTAKWGGAVVTALMLATWIGSAWGKAFWFAPKRYYGCVALGRFYIVDTGTAGIPIDRRGGLLEYQPEPLEWWLEHRKSIYGNHVGIPLWFPTLISLLFSVFAWRADSLSRRRARVGRCPLCGYDRSGLAANSVCSECGEVPSA